MRFQNTVSFFQSIIDSTIITHRFQIG